jgi:vacuolar-type H+-ATPase subunit E/Vma4
MSASRLPDPQVRTALAPVRAALLAAARAEAGQIRERAEVDAAATLAVARAAAARIRDQARAQGVASGTAAAATERHRARRAARADVRRAQREGYEQLLAAAREAVARLPAEPGYPGLHRRLVAAVTGTLGEGARLAEAAGGGVVGVAPGRRVDFSLAGFADRAVRAVASQLVEGPAP